MIQFIVYLLLFYILFKAVKYFFRYLMAPSSPREQRTAKPEETKVKDEISKEDIIEADFDEIEPDDKN